MLDDGSKAGRRTPTNIVANKACVELVSPTPGFIAGSISSLGVTALLKCATEEATFQRIGRIHLKMPLIDTARKGCAGRIDARTCPMQIGLINRGGRAGALLIWLRQTQAVILEIERMNVSFRLLNLAPVVVFTKVWKPRPWPISCNTTVSISMALLGLLPSRP